MEMKLTLNFRLCPRSFTRRSSRRRYMCIRTKCGKYGAIPTFYQRRGRVVPMCHTFLMHFPSGRVVSFHRGSGLGTQVYIPTGSARSPILTTKQGTNSSTYQQVVHYLGPCNLPGQPLCSHFHDLDDRYACPARWALDVPRSS